MVTCTKQGSSKFSQPLRLSAKEARQTKKRHPIILCDLINGNIVHVFASEDEMCYEGFRKGSDDKPVRGVPHRTKDDCFRFCYIDTCDSL